MRLLFVETTGFTRRIREQRFDEDLRELQAELLLNPAKGAIDPARAGCARSGCESGPRGAGKARAREFTTCISSTGGSCICCSCT